MKRQRNRRKKFWRFMMIFGLICLIVIALLTVYRKNRLNELRSTTENYLIEEQTHLVHQLNRLFYPLPKVSLVFLPDYPAHYIDIQHIPQQNVPLILQNDPQWATISYGTDGSKKLWENGCAIVSLAMVDQYFNHANLNPRKLAQWAGDEYYHHGQGTSWDIYPAFGDAFGYQVIELGNHLSRAIEYLELGYSIVVSVKPGFFTEAGHVMVLRGYGSGLVYLNDPNDDVSKMYSIQGIPKSYLDETSMNYWAICPQ